MDCQAAQIVAAVDTVGESACALVGVDTVEWEGTAQVVEDMRAGVDTVREDTRAGLDTVEWEGMAAGMDRQENYRKVEDPACGPALYVQFCVLT